MMGFCSIGTTKTAHGIDFMHKLLTAAFCFVAASVFAANPDFRNFNTNQFGTNGLNITVRSGAKMTNIVLEGVATGNAGGLTNVLARFGIDSLGHANVINATNHGVIPYIAPNFLTGAFPTNAVDNSVALSNLFRFASNSPAPRLVYLPPGFIAYTQTLTIPPLTHIIGEGYFHQCFGATRALSATNYSVLWWRGSTNGTAVRVPYSSLGFQSFRNFEICGATNAMTDLGQAPGDISTIRNQPSANLGACGLNFDAGNYCGGFELEDMMITGFRIGVNHAGNFCSYERVQFNGNDVGFVSTNIWAPDQVRLKMCSVGNRKGGIGYWLLGGRGFIIEDPADIDYRTWAVLNHADITRVGGNSETGTGELPDWCFAGVTSQGAVYVTNVWQYGCGVIESYSWSGNSGVGAIQLLGGNFGDNGAIQCCLINDIAAVWGGGHKVFGRGVSFSTTNQVSGQDVLARLVNVSSYDVDWVSSENPVMQTYNTTLGAGTLVGTIPSGRNSLATPSNFEIINNLNIGFYTGMTNLVLGQYGLLKLQHNHLTGPDWVQIYLATNILNGIPQLAGFRLILSDPAPTGLANTNLTVELLKWRTGTNLNTSYIPTNTAPYAITTNNFVLNAFNTNANQRAYISASIFLANSAGGADVAKVNLYLDQDANGTFEQTGIEVQNTELSVLGSTFQLGAYLQPGARFMFTNTSTAGATGVSIVAGSCQRVTQ